MKCMTVNSDEKKLQLALQEDSKFPIPHEQRDRQCKITIEERQP